MKNKKTCKICGDKHYAKGYCQKHYNKAIYDGEIITNNEICSVKWCDKNVHAKCYCKKHYEQIKYFGYIKKDKLLNTIVVHDNYAEIIIHNKDNEVIALTQIDLDDVKKVRNKNLSLRNKKYIVINIKDLKTNKLKSINLHRYLMDAKDNEIVDHIDRNPLNNKKANLRICITQQNNMNKSLRKDSPTEVIGVVWDKERCKWRSFIKINYKLKALGRFDKFEDAAKVRLQAEKELFGEFSGQKHLYEKYGVE